MGTPLPHDVAGEILRLAQLHGRSCVEIAQETGVQEITVRDLLARYGVSTAYPGSVIVLCDPGGDYAKGARFHKSDLYLGMIEMDGGLAWNEGTRFLVLPFHRNSGEPYKATVTGAALIREDTGERLEVNRNGGGKWVAQ